MSMEPSRIGGLVRLVRTPGGLLTSGKGNVELWANLLIIAWAIGFMVWNGVGYAIAVGTVFGIWAILTVSLNLVVGFTGLLSVGHIGFFGVGAYAMAILTSSTDYTQLRTDSIPTFEWPFFAALPASAILAGVVAIAVGAVLNRFRDDIFVLVSFGFAIYRVQYFSELACCYEGRVRHPRCSQAGDIWLEAKWRARVSGLCSCGSRPCRIDLLVHSDLVIRTGAYSYTGGMSRQ